MIKFHPTHQQLSEFVEGSLSPAISLMVAAHCDMCEKCRLRVELETEALAEELLSGASSVDSQMVFGDMLANITSSPSDTTTSEPIRASSDGRLFERPLNNEGSQGKDATSIELDGRRFELPSTLHRYTKKTGGWSSLVGKLWQAPVDLGNQGVANFIYMAQGGSVPEHTHRGTEYTLVIDGEFSDGLNHYDTGDFIFMDGEKTHTPRADTKEGCLVFSIVDQPLHFTSGLARLLNPFSHLFFR
jgi:putative transcriptional regulator